VLTYGLVRVEAVGGQITKTIPIPEGIGQKERAKKN